VLDCKTAQETV